LSILRIIIAGGGTGGHIFPAIAIAKAILALRPDSEILFVGAEGKMEMEKVPAAGFKIIGLPIVGIQRRLTLKNLLLPLKVIQSLIKARGIIKNFKPHVAIGVGGYASGPLLRAASALGVKTLLQEQNSYPGITNKILSKKADKICVAYEGLEKFFPHHKIVFTGNPVRPEVVQLDGKRNHAQEFFHLDPNKKTLLVVGGSLGARTINHSIRSCADLLVKHDFQIIWQTGKSYAQSALAFAVAHDSDAIHVFEFIQKMDLAYAAADIIVSRAGAMSISELCLVKKPAILIPSPNVSEDHQTKNAMALVNKKAAVLIRDDEAEKVLGNEIIALLNDETKMNSLSTNIAKLGFANASEAIANEVFKLVDTHS